MVPSQGRAEKFSTNDIPFPQATLDKDRKRWKKEYLSTLLKFAGCQLSGWVLENGPLVHAMRQIWNEVFPHLEDTIITDPRGWKIVHYVVSLSTSYSTS